MRVFAHIYNLAVLCVVVVVRAPDAVIGRRMEVWMRLWGVRRLTSLLCTTPAQLSPFAQDRSTHGWMDRGI